MATAVERATAIADALFNRVATTQEKQDIAAAFIKVNRQWIIDRGFNPDTLTASQKSHLFIIKVREYVQTIVGLAAYQTTLGNAASTAESDQAAAKAALGSEDLV